MTAKRLDRQAREVDRILGRLVASCLAGLVASAAGIAATAPDEPPPVLAAADLAPGLALDGADYQVEPRVPTDGFLAHYTVRSPFGVFSAVGPGMLETRVREVQALATLQTLEQSDEVQQGAKAAANKALEGIKHFVDEPTETLKGVPEGVGRFFQRTYRSAKTGVQKLSDVDEGRAPGAPPASGPGARLPGGVAEAGAAGGNVYAAGVAAAGNAALAALGYDDTRRRLAKRVGVDPYTSNRALAKKLDDVAWAGFAGDLGVDVLTATIPGGALVAGSTRLSNWVWDTPPGDLRLAVERSLLALGASQGDVDLLLRHRWYPLSLQAALVLALDDMNGLGGRLDVLPLALTVASEEQARFLVQTLQMTARYHATVAPLESLVVLGTVAARAKDGAVVVAAPVDYLTWNAAVDRFSAHEELAAPRRTIHLAGQASERARAELAARGWAVETRSPLFQPMLAPAVSD